MPWLAAVVGLVVTSGAGVMLLRRSSPSPEALSIPAAVEALHTGPDLAPWVARARTETDPLARARTVAEAVQQRRVAGVIVDDDPVPPPRTPDTLWRVVAVQGEKVTPLDLARMITAVLRDAGDTTAAVAWRTAAPRHDVPADPTGSLGSFGVAVAGHLLDVTHGDLVAATQAPHQALTERQVAAVVAAQQAVSEAETGVRDRAVQSAGAAVDLWPDGAVPLASRARVWRIVGASSGLPLAEADLRGAMAGHDEASYRLALSRVLLVSGRAGEAAAEAVRAVRMAPAWGPAALAAVALRPVLLAQDAASPPTCGPLQAAREPWTDDAWTLCGEGTDQAPAPVRTAAADRLLATSRDPLRLAFAAARSPGDTRAVLVSRVGGAQRREAATWLMLLGRPDLAVALQPPEGDGGR